MTTAQRIVSFLPSATEMACALGLHDQCVGITHECDYPPSVREKPIVVSSAISMASMTQAEIDKTVSERMRNGQSLYQVDEKLLHELAPDLILTYLDFIAAAIQSQSFQAAGTNCGVVKFAPAVWTNAGKLSFRLDTSNYARKSFGSKMPGCRT